ncbi:MAG: hypothetical protein V4623_02290 [Pseudomonadota bacterium]
MRRMRTLVRRARAAYPDNTFFDSLEETLRISSQARASYRAYDKALSSLDPKSWKVLSDKAVKHFCDHRSGQLKQGFFNQINEAFVYQFLVRQGYTNVSVLAEDGKKTPDLSYMKGASIGYCEVKSIGMSDKEIVRTEHEAVFDAEEIYHERPSGFLKKLGDAIKQGDAQIRSKGATGIVFVVVQFDDFTLAHYGRYSEQIKQLLAQHEVLEVFIKVGLLGDKKIHKQPLGA